MDESNKANDHDLPESEGPDIVEPELGAATISDDVAETVDLKAAEAEAAAVEHEVELASQGVSPELGASDAGAPAAPAVETPKSPAKVGSPEKTVADPTAADSSLTAEETAGADMPVDAWHLAPEEAPESAPEPATDPATVAPEVASAKEPTAPESAPEEATVVPPQVAGHFGPGVDDGHGWRRPEAKWEQSSTPWQPKAGAWQSPAQISRNAADAAAASAAGASAETGPQATPPAAAAIPPSIPEAPATAPGAQAAAPPASATPGGANADSGSDGNPKKILIIAGIVLVALALLVLLIMLLVGLFTGDKSNSNALPAGSQSAQSTQSLASTAKNSGDTGSDLIVAGVSPLDWMAGDCLRDFKGTSEPADVVLCNSPHNAQLVGTFYYADTDTFPGTASLKVKAADVCKGVVFTSEASGLTTLKQTTAYPSEATWDDKDDRRVDCMVHDTRSGNALKVSLTQ